MGVLPPGMLQHRQGVPRAGMGGRSALGVPCDPYWFMGPPERVRLPRVVLTSAASSVNIDIPTGRFGVVHLYTKVRITGGLSTDVHIFATLNGDATAANYSWQEHGGGAATNYSVEGIGDARGVIVGLMNVSADNAKRFAVNHTRIPFYGAQDADKVTLTEMAVDQDSTGLHVKHHMVGTWSPSTAAPIRRLTLAPEGGQFAIGCVFEVHLEP